MDSTRPKQVVYLLKRGGMMRTPELYERSTAPFWNDTYISEQMLKAHLNPDFEGASRRADFINASADWIAKEFGGENHLMLLDLGCGPGIYAEKFATSGFQVTGVDYSERSINYARQSAEEKGLSIKYIFQNYLELNLEMQFDVITLIYCDYGALTAKERLQIVEVIHKHLKPGGKVLLDVFTDLKLGSFEEGEFVTAYPDGGFWSRDAHKTIQRVKKYEPNIMLEQTKVVHDNDEVEHYLWTTTFTQESLEAEFHPAGFRTVNVYGDVAGSTYTDKTETLAVVFEKVT